MLIIFQVALKEKNIIFKLVPRHQHRKNTAERDIQMFKIYLFAGLANCDLDFPLREWD